MPKLEPKNYYCPVCKTISSHNTNHVGDIYTNCKECGYTILFCKEREWSRFTGQRYLRGTRLHYNFSLDYVTDLIQYKALCNYLLTLKQANGSPYQKHTQLLNPMSKWLYRLENHACTAGRNHVKVFDFQESGDTVMSQDGRLYYWFEARYPNKDIKKGYYLLLEGKTEIF